jgi:hypothetical protein
MNKFLLMIISVSVFFIGLGGIVKQIKTLFKPAEQISFERTLAPKIREKRIASTESFTVFEREGKQVIINRMKERVPNDELKIRLPESNEFGQTFERQLNPEIPNPVEELPRMTEENVIIMKERNGAQPKISKSIEEMPRVKVFIDKENNSK